MATSQKFFLFLLRVSAGWMFFYAGITKVLNPQWSAEGYLKGAKSFVWFYQWLLQPEILPIINSINKWGPNAPRRIFDYRPVCPLLSSLLGAFC